MTTISPIRYEVEIQEPLSTPVPMPPSMLSSEALVIWMFRIAMNEPIIAASTAIQTVMLARFGSTLVPVWAAGSARADMDMTLSSENLARRADRSPGGGDCATLERLRLGLDCRDHRHAGPQFDASVIVAVQRVLDGNALHHLAEIAGGVIRRQQREFLAAGGCEAVDVAMHILAGAQRAIADDAVDRRDDGGIFEIEFGLALRCFRT